jgi:hypothetical protein
MLAEVIWRTFPLLLLPVLYHFHISLNTKQTSAVGTASLKTYRSPTVMEAPCSGGGHQHKGAQIGSSCYWIPLSPLVGIVQCVRHVIIPRGTRFSIQAPTRTIISSNPDGSSWVRSRKIIKRKWTDTISFLTNAGVNCNMRFRNRGEKI